eukprot:268670_1
MSVDTTEFKSNEQVILKSYFDKYLIIDDNNKMATKSRSDISDPSEMLFSIENTNSSSNECKETQYLFKSQSGKYLSHNSENKFKIISCSNALYNIKLCNGMYLTALKNGNIETNRKKAGYWERWQIIYTTPIKIHIYGIKNCPLYQTTVEIDGNEYFWFNQNNKVQQFIPSQDTKLQELEVISKYIELSKLKILETLVKIKSQWNNDISYHLIKHNCNHFTLALLKEIGSGADENLPNKYFDHDAVTKFVNYNDSKIDDEIVNNSMSQIMTQFVSNKFNAGDTLCFKSFFNQYLSIDEQGAMVTKAKKDISDQNALVFTVENKLQLLCEDTKEEEDCNQVIDSKQQQCLFDDWNQVLNLTNNNNGIQFEIIPLSKSLYSIKTYNSNGIYVTALSNGKIATDRTKASTWEQWKISKCCLIKIHVYGIQNCPIYQTTVEIDGVEYFWSNDDKVKSCEMFSYDEHKNIEEIEVITRLVDICVHDALVKLDTVRVKWDDDEKCIYQLIKNNCNHFTQDLLREIGNGADKDMPMKYFVDTHRELKQIVQYHHENDTDEENNNFISMCQTMKYYVLNNRRCKTIEILKQCGVNLPIHQRSMWDIGKLILKSFAIGGLFVLIQKAGVDKEFMAKIFLGLCWIVPQFIAHFFNADIEQFVYPIIIEFHTCACLLMGVYGMYVMLTSWNKYQWKYSISFAIILMLLSAIYYIIFYSFYVASNILGVISMPICWKWLYQIQVTVSKTDTQIAVMVEEEYYSLDEKEKQYIVRDVSKELKKIKQQKINRQAFTTLNIVLLLVCFSFKIYSGLKHANYMRFVWNENIINCDSVDDAVCYWIKEELKLVEYYSVLEHHGFDTMELVCTLTEENMKYMGIDKQGHINKIIGYINQHCDTQSIEETICDI